MKIKKILVIALILFAGKSYAQFDYKLISNAKEIILTNVTIIDGNGNQPIADQIIIIKDGRIKDIFKTGVKPNPKNSKKIDMMGYYVIPGLIDAHYHFLTSVYTPTKQDSLLIYAFIGGLTGFRDMAGDAIALKELSQKTILKEFPKPRIYYSALFAGNTWFDNDKRASLIMHKFPSGTASWAKSISDTTDIELAVTQAKQSGASGIKIYADLDGNKIKEITNEAHKQGLKVWTHATVFPAKPSDAVNANVDALSHSIEFTWELEENMPVAFDKRPNDYYKTIDWNKFHFDDPKTSNLLDSMKIKGIMLDATSSHAHTRYVLRQLIQPEDKRTINFPLKIDEWVDGFTNLAYRKGVNILAGTDYQENMEKFDYPNIHAEMEYLVKNCGLSELDAIKSATLNVADILSISSNYGSIEVGKIADIVVLKKDPTKDIANTKSVLYIIKEGVIYQRK